MLVAKKKKEETAKQPSQKQGKRSQVYAVSSDDEVGGEADAEEEQRREPASKSRSRSKLSSGNHKLRRPKTVPADGKREPTERELAKQRPATTAFAAPSTTAARLSKTLASTRVTRLRAENHALTMVTSGDMVTETNRMRQLFKEIDSDGSGYLQLKEVKALCKKLGDRLSTTVLEEAFDRMDPEMTGKVGFDAFQKWWRLKEDTNRRELRQSVGEVFHMVDANGSGTLNKEEVALLAAKVSKKFSGIEFDPPFAVDTDFAVMDVSNRGEVTCEEFTVWFKARTGDDEPSIPVLPEYLVNKVGMLSAVDNGEDRESRSGKELWGFLRPRLDVLIKLQRQWGDVL